MFLVVHPWPTTRQAPGEGPPLSSSTKAGTSSLINAALDIHADDPAFGYRFIADELPARGISAGENKVARLCSQQRIWSAFSKKRGLNRKTGPPVHDDLAARQFTAPGPDRTWLTGITEHPTAEGKLYLCAIKDVYSTRIAGYSMSARMTAELAVSALRNAIALRSPAATVVVHSDRGSQFRSAQRSFGDIAALVHRDCRAASVSVPHDVVAASYPGPCQRPV